MIIIEYRLITGYSDQSTLFLMLEITLLCAFFKKRNNGTVFKRNELRRYKMLKDSNALMIYLGFCLGLL